MASNLSLVFYLYASSCRAGAARRFYSDRLSKEVFEDKTWGGQEGSRYNPSVHTHAQFAGMITRLDYYVGEVLNKLKEKGLDENTIVILPVITAPMKKGELTLPSLVVMANFVD